MPKKILILGNSHLVVFGFRGELIERLVSEGYEVVTSFPNSVFGEGEGTSRLYSCRFHETRIERRKTNPIQDLRLLSQYIRMIQEEKPDVVLAYTVKPDIYGGIACRMTGTAFIPNITGLGKGLVDGGMVSEVLVSLYKLALRKAHIVFFQNEDDRRFFQSRGIHFSRSLVLPGSGVNLEKYRPLPYPPERPVVFTYIARVMKAKGIEQFLEAAEAVHRKHTDTQFHICGYCEEDYKNRIAEAEAQGIVVYHGLVSEIMEYETISHCIVLPSFHPEGISNVLLEAAACARPIITTDRPGCRETVEDGVTGLLVRERDSRDLIEKMELFLSLSPDARKEMGLKGREKVERDFNRQIVVEAYLKEIQGIER